jgi:hypothetical protein
MYIYIFCICIQNDIQFIKTHQNVRFYLTHFHSYIKIDIIPGSSKKNIDQKVPTCTGSPRTPCINVATYHFSMAGARMAVFFEGSAKHCGHTTLKLGDQRCQTLLARLQVGWLFSS